MIRWGDVIQQRIESNYQVQNVTLRWNMEVLY